MMYPATVSICSIVLLATASVAMAADPKDRDGGQWEVHDTPYAERDQATSATGALRERAPSERSTIGRRSPKESERMQPGDSVPSWVHWPTLTDF